MFKTELKTVRTFYIGKEYP